MFYSVIQHPNDYESYFNLMEVCEDNEQVPLQFFSTFPHNQTRFTHSNKPADSDGFFNISASKVKVCRVGPLRHPGC